MSRLKEIRDSFNLSQAEFSARIRLNQSYYSQIERGLAKLNDRIIKLICDEFNVNEDWLRNGVGEMRQIKTICAPIQDESVGFAIFRTLSPEKQTFALNVLMNLREMQEKEEKKEIAAFDKRN